MKVLRNQLFLPLNFEVLIDENDPVRKLTEICDTLDYTKLYDVYNKKRGNDIISVRIKYQNKSIVTK